MEMCKSRNMFTLLCLVGAGFLSMGAVAQVDSTPSQDDSIRTTSGGRGAATVAPTIPPGCHPSQCKLPDCLCASRSIPGGLLPQDTPQMIVFTFDDAVNELVIDSFQDLFTPDRQNPNGCPITMTLFISHQYTNYCMVSDLWEQGHEMASHSITHRTPISFWKDAPVSEYDKEINDQKKNIADLGGIEANTIKGYRSPFLQPGGDIQFTILKERGFSYDASLLVNVDQSTDLYWPYTLNYPRQIPCEIVPCPSKSYPLWEVPLQPMTDSNGEKCSFWDKCDTEATSVNEVYRNLMNHFLRSYARNKAPMIINVHAEWFTSNIYALPAFNRFLDDVSVRKDVWVVTVSQALEWIRNPTPLSDINRFVPWQCKERRVSGRCMALRAVPGRNRTQRDGFNRYDSTLQDGLPFARRLHDGGVGLLVFTIFLFGGAFVYLAFNNSE